MICPNCGRELPDTARICPGCSAVQRVFKRRHADADLPEPGEPVRVTRRVAPQQSETKHQRDNDAQSRGDRQEQIRAEKKQVQAGDRMGYGAENFYAQMPIGLSKQAARQQEQARQVRRAPDRIYRKIDARPAMMDPPIYRKSHKRLLRVVFIIVLIALFVGSAGAYMLFQTESGQHMMATWGWEIARTDAYVTLGRELLEQAYFTRSLEMLSVAVEREPQNVDALVLMGQAYTELGQIEEAKAIYQSLIDEIAPAHPSAYRNLIKILQSEGYNAEALALMKTASENASSTQEFAVMLREYTPEAPKFSWEEGRYNEEKDLTISVPEGQTVYYTIDGTDPSEAGLVYKPGTVIHIPEGKMTVKAIGFTQDGTPSEQIEGIYTVIIPTPAAPKSNYASGVYKKAPKVTLRPGSEDKKENDMIVAIYYTLDGRQATTESTLYTEPIQLPIGDSRLRAIAVASNGKVSYEMNVTYKVEGNLKNMFGSKDTFKNMELYKTGYKTFSNNWGKPSSYEMLPEEEWYSPDMESYEAVYSWGVARFCIKTKDGSPVLYYLDTTNSKMTAPRTTRVGMDAETVLSKYRDLGQAALDSDGNRLLYNYNSGNYQFGTYRREADGNYAIHYYYPIGDKKEVFVELSYYLDEDNDVARIVWQRYLSELTGS